MTITINQIESGIGLNINGHVYMVLEYQHVKPGKGSAFVRVKLKSLVNDSVLERTFRTSEKLENVEIQERELEYLYSDGTLLHFMDHTTYEEVAVARELLGASERFLLENLTVTGMCYDNKIVKVILPNFIISRIIASEPGIRGDSTRSGNKPATIETGAAVAVPLFINIGDWVKIDTRDGQYVERVQR
ncbi:MAG: elongation factor P [Candidatus Omnitrophica bacterium]|nr:elongation factor P [Candidatus Omnitrophota bacterium]